MILEAYEAPHIRHNETARTIMGDAIMTMAILYVMAFYYYGQRVWYLLLTGVACALLTDVVCTLLSGHSVNIRDYSAIVTGMILPLLMPATIDYGIVAIAAAFAILVAKHPFGGVGHNVFNPAAAGFSFVAICFSDKLFTYPLPHEKIPVSGAIDVITGISPAFTLGLGGTPKYDFVDMALGNFPGPMGTTNILVILACLLYLVSRNTVRWVTPVCFFAASAAFAWLFPRIGDGAAATSLIRLQSVQYELMSGMLMFGGAFMLGDPVTSPKRGWSKAAYAIAVGIAVMLFRRFGDFEEELPFAILFMNATVWAFDMAGEFVASFIRRRAFENISGQSVQKKK